MRTSVFMSEIPWTEYQRRLTEEDAIVLLPCGALEQHGPHLPLGVDWMLATEMARRAAERVGAVVAPPFAYGYKSQPRTGGGNHFCGNVALDGNNLTLMLRDVLKEFGKHGAKKVAVIDGHYENESFLTEGCDLAVRDMRRDGIADVKILKMRYCEDIKQETIDAIYSGEYPGLALEHAAVLETSMMLYLFPDLVDLDKLPSHPPAEFPPYDLYPLNPDWIPETGALMSAKGSSAEIGKTLVTEFVDLVSRSLENEFRSQGRARARRVS